MAVLDQKGLLYLWTKIKGAFIPKVKSHENELVKLNADGNIEATGYVLGGATLASSPNATTLATEAAVNAAVTALGSVLEFKGLVDNMTALNAVDTKKVGDVYHVKDNGGEYVWVMKEIDGEETGVWEPLGLVFDPSSLSSDITALQGRATAVEERATTLEGRATALEGRATTLETTVGAEGKAAVGEEGQSDYEPAVAATGLFKYVDDSVAAEATRATGVEAGLQNAIDALNNGATGAVKEVYFKDFDGASTKLTMTNGKVTIEALTSAQIDAAIAAAEA